VRSFFLMMLAACTAETPTTPQIGPDMRVEPEVGWAAGRVIVRTESKPGALTSPLGALTRQRAYQRIPYAVYTFDPAVDVQEMVRSLQAQGLFAEPDYKRTILVNDPLRSVQWHFDNVNADNAWAESTGSGIVVAVLDTGVSDGPTDGIGSLSADGYDFVNSDTDPDDDHGHGTHVAGTVAQASDNNIGVAGLAYDAEIMAIKVMDQNGSGYTSDLISGIEHAVLYEADVINMSLGSISSSTSEEAAIDDAWDAGVFVVAASGNSNAATAEYPAAYDNCISVGATDLNDARSYYSNQDPDLDLTAPGGDITVDADNSGYVDGVLQEAFFVSGGVKQWGYYFFQGTSMAAPHVAAAAALIMEHGATNDEAIRHLRETAVDLGTAGQDSSYGYGLIDAEGAVDAYLADINTAPSLTNPGDMTVAEGSELALSAVSSDDDGDTVTYSWDFGDGNLSEELTPGHTWGEDGTYTVTLTADDGAQADNSTVTVSFDVVVTNVTPTIDAASATAAPEGSSTTFSASASDPGTDDTALSYSWAYGDGSSGSANEHVYTQDGTYTATLTVTDSDGAQATQDVSVTVANVAPTIDSISAPAGVEGVPLTLNVDTTDPGADDANLTYSWDYGDSFTGSSNTHVYEDNGSYTVTLTVTDSDGAQDTETHTVSIANAAPTLSVTPPAVALEGVELNAGFQAIDVSGDTITVSFDWGDGSVGAANAHTYADNGAYTLTVTADDEDGGSTQVSHVVSVQNVAPVIGEVDLPISAEEGVAASFGATASDVPVDTLTYSWTFGDGTIATDPNPSHTWADNGVYWVDLTVTDKDGGQSTASHSVTVSNVAPVVAELADITIDEGSDANVLASATDVPRDTLSYAWSWGDGQNSTGNPGVHAYDDNGTYTVQLNVTDKDGGSGVQSFAATVENVAPTFTDAPATGANEGQTFGWTPAVDEPGDDELSFTLVSGPDGMTIDPADGTVSWTPTGEQALEPTASFSINVADDDGGENTAVWTVDVAFADEDGDDISDYWEDLNGLDSSVDDTTEDPDADGRDNAKEFEDRTNPLVWEGPPIPTLDAPADGAEADTITPDLAWIAEEHERELDQTFEVEIYSDDTLSQLLVTATPDIETWTVDSELVEDSWAWWRVRSVDEFTASPWTDAWSMRINAEESAPNMPEPAFPILGEIAAADPLELQWTPSTDADDDAMSYHVVVFDSVGTTVVDDTVDHQDAPVQTYAPSVAWVEDETYTWTVSTEDEHGMTSETSDEASFLRSTFDGPPVGLQFVSPEPGDGFVSTQPDVVFTEAVDPEGSAVSYELELDMSDSFDSADLVQVQLDGEGTMELTWAAADDAIELLDRTDWHARVRATDESDISSPWEVISFRVGGPDLPPEAPTPLSPEDGFLVSVGTEVELVTDRPADPDQDAVTVHFVVATDADLQDVVAEGSDDGTGDARFVFTVPQNGEALYWAAMAQDSTGLESPWSDAQGLAVGSGDENAGCGCVSGGTTPMWMISLLPLAFARRRRR